MLRAQNFQTIDDAGIPPELRPHTMLPALAVHAGFPDRFAGLDAGLDFEIADFAHNYDDRVATGWRMDVAPEIRWPLRGAGVYLEPAAGWRYTAYRLDEAALSSADDSPTRSAPVLSVDGGLVFERSSGSRGQRLMTLEPRFMYLYVPYRNQDDLPVFDTAPADLNLVQLFRTNRYVGADRLSDANQISIGESPCQRVRGHDAPSARKKCAHDSGCCAPPRLLGDRSGRDLEQEHDDRPHQQRD